MRTRMNGFVQVDPAGCDIKFERQSRELPTYLQMPHWMKLLPATHPIDFFHDSLGQASHRSRCGHLTKVICRPRFKANYPRTRIMATLVR